MANVNIKFNGKDYLLSCDDGQEESLKRLTSQLDAKYRELKEKLGVHVDISHSSSKKGGKIVIKYSNLEILDGLLKKLGYKNKNY